MTGHLADDSFVALALGELAPAERDALRAHLDACPACASEARSVADAVRYTVAVAPSIAPPEGFAARVLGAREPSAPRVQAPARDPRWARWLAVLAGVLIGAVAGAALTLGVLAARGVPWPEPQRTAPAASALVTESGDAVGITGTALVDGRAALVLTITGGRPGMTYECVLVGADGTRTSGGTWTLAESGYGTGAGGTWTVPLPASELTAVELVTPTGAVWATARW